MKKILSNNNNNEQTDKKTEDMDIIIDHKMNGTFGACFVLSDDANENINGFLSKMENQDYLNLIDFHNAFIENIGNYGSYIKNKYNLGLVTVDNCTLTDNCEITIPFVGIDLEEEPIYQNYIWEKFTNDKLKNYQILAFRSMQILNVPLNNINIYFTYRNTIKNIINTMTISNIVNNKRKSIIIFLTASY